MINEPSDATAVLAVDRVVFPAWSVEFVERDEIRRACFGVDVGAPGGLAGPNHQAGVLVDQAPSAELLGTAEAFADESAVWGEENKEGKKEEKNKIGSPQPLVPAQKISNGICLPRCTTRFPQSTHKQR